MASQDGSHPDHQPPDVGASVPSPAPGTASWQPPTPYGQPTPTGAPYGQPTPTGAPLAPPYGQPTPTGAPPAAPYGQPTPTGAPYGQPTPTGAPTPPPAGGPYGQPTPPAYPAAAADSAPGGRPNPGPPPGYPAAGAPGQATFGGPGYPPGPGQPPAYGQPDPTLHLPTPPAPPTPTKKSGGRKVGIVLGVVVALVVVGLVASWALGLWPKSPATRAKETAQTYLTALAKGSASEALQLLAQAPSDTSLLTDAALAAARQSTPMADVAVEDPIKLEDELFDVPIKYRLGTDLVVGSITVSVKDTPLVTTTPGVLKLDRVGIPVTVNGIKPTSDRPAIFPGTYALASTQSYFALGSNNSLLVRGLDEVPSIPDMHPQLTPEGQQTFRAKVAAAVETCMASTVLQGGCGIDIPETLKDGTHIRENSIVRSLPAETRSTMENVTGQPDSARPSLVRATEELGKITIAAECNPGSGWGKCTITGGELGQPTVDFSTPALTVGWD